MREKTERRMRFNRFYLSTLSMLVTVRVRRYYANMYFKY